MNRRTALGAIAALAAAPLAVRQEPHVVGVVAESTRKRPQLLVTFQMSDGTKVVTTAQAWHTQSWAAMVGRPLSRADLELV